MAPWWTAAIALSTVALAARGVSFGSSAIVVCAGAVGLIVPLRAGHAQPLLRWWVITAAAAVPFLLARSVWPLTGSAGRWAVVAAVGAGIGEELLFRRGMYGLLARWGSLAAVVGSAVAFGLVHVPIYGWKVLAVNVTAGLVFGWQRWASGSWTSPAATHAVVNAIQYL